MFHKKLKKQRKMWEDGGVMQQQNREAAERVAQYAAQSGDKYDELLAQGSGTPHSRIRAEQPGPAARPSP